MIDSCKVIRTTTGQIVFVGTERECRKYVRTHYDTWSRIYRADNTIARK